MSGAGAGRVGKWSYVLMGGHLCTDINQGAMSAVLPFLVMHGGYSYAEVSLLVLGSTVVSAVVQPLFGLVGDRRACPWFMALGVLLAGAGMAGVGFCRRCPPSWRRLL